MQIKSTDKELFLQRGHTQVQKNIFGQFFFPLEVKIHNNKRVDLDKWKSFISWQHFNK